MKKLLFFSIGIISACTISAQQVNETQNPRLKLKSASVATSSEIVISKYGNMEELIRKRLIKPEFPTSLPELDKNKETIDAYKIRVQEWFTKNNEFVKPEYKNTPFNSDK